MQQYYYMDAQGQTQGPVGENDLRELRMSGAAQDNTYVAVVGSTEWKPLSEAISPATPPPPADGGTPPPPDGTGNPPPPGGTGNPPPPNEGKGPSSGRKCHELDYEIIGDDIQVVEVELDPGDTVVAEAGAMNYLEDGIQFEAKMGDGSKPDQDFLGKETNSEKHLSGGESIFITHFTNNLGVKRKAAFAAPYPGRIVPINMAKAGGEIICQKDSFLCAALGTEVSIAFTTKLGNGKGCIFQKLKGDGMVFLHAGGTVMKKELRAEILRVDTGCIVGFTSAVSYDLQMEGRLKSMFLGNEGMPLATLSGSGSVWLQSLPFSRLAGRIEQATSSTGPKEKEED